MSQPAQLPRRFGLHRRYDVTGVSGTGLVAYGTQYPTGRVTLAWCCSDIQSVAVYDDIDDVESIHGHGGLTEIRWIDPPHVPEPSVGAHPSALTVLSGRARCATATQHTA
ncbi:hypothetical protein [Jiangella anatolica]|uniref:hypothetical protein n=1 Tax=Jiangella anatolica TaxID=2670374 RepID=UPI0018F79DA4|nr:hypothetical protein [Jiangella anatolica]